MRFITVANSGFAILARNLAASAGWFGLDLTVYISSAEMSVPNAKCELLEDQTVPPEATRLGSEGYRNACRYKLRVISENLKQRRHPFLYLDCDAAFIKDPRPALAAVPVALALQDRTTGPFREPRLWHPYCLGVVYVSQYEPWMEMIFLPEIHAGLFDDEWLVNERLHKRRMFLEGKVAPLPGTQFVLGYCRSTPEAVVYHANFAQKVEDKIQKLKREKAWFLK